MSVSPAAMRAWCEKILGVHRPERSLTEYLGAIPRLDSLASLKSGTPVLVRGDLDAEPGAQKGEGDVRLKSMVETLDFGRQRGWKQVVIGHRGRKPKESLAAVAGRLGEWLGCDAPLETDWLDAETTTIRPAVAERIAASEPGSVLVLENTRQYAIETILWRESPEKVRMITADDLPQLVDSLAKIANEFAEKVARVYVNEAFSAGSLDASTVVVPAAMESVALGAYAAAEFSGPMMRCLAAQLVVFSGLKTDKLDDLAAIVGRGSVKMVFLAGSLAMAVKKAAAALDGGDFCLGLAENPAHSGKSFYISPERVEQARRMLVEGRSKGMEFVLPVDFVLQDDRASAGIGPHDQQFDVGPKTSELFAAKVGEFLAARRGSPAVVFHNGVFGMFEDPRFAEGTRRFMGQLKRMKEAGAEVYVGGGEGGKALEQEKYTEPNDVTHCFTAGGTVLNALGSEPVPYLVALSMAAGR